MKQAFHLFRIQQIDTKIDQACSNIEDLDKLLADNEAATNARFVLDELTKTLHQDLQSLKSVEFSVKNLQIKISQSESNLYGGKVRNPKELQDLQKEISSLKNQLSHLEDEQLDVMMSIEEKEVLVKEAQETLQNAQAIFSEKSSSWNGQKNDLMRLIERLKAERNTITPPISPNNLLTYDNIRKRKSGVAVTTARDGSCVVCGASIRPMELQAARIAQDLVYCTTCGRILYVG